MKTRALTLFSVLLTLTSLIAAVPSHADGNDGNQQKITVRVGKVTKNPDSGGKQGGQSDGGKKSQGNGGK